MTYSPDEEHQQPSSPDAVVYDRRPVMINARPFLFLFLCMLIPVGIGVLALLAWYLGCMSNRLTVDERTVRLQQGLLSKRVKEISSSKVRAIEVDQSFIERITKVGRVRIYTTGDDPEITMSALPNPYEIKDAVDRAVEDAE